MHGWICGKFPTNPSKYFASNVITVIFVGNFLQILQSYARQRWEVYLRSGEDEREGSDSDPA